MSQELPRLNLIHQTVAPITINKRVYDATTDIG